MAVVNIELSQVYGNTKTASNGFVFRELRQGTKLSIR